MIGLDSKKIKSSPKEDEGRRGRYYLTKKQREIMRVIVKYNPDGSFVSIHELISRLPWETTEHSMRFSIRALERRGFIEKRRLFETGCRVGYAPTYDGMVAIRKNI